MNYFLANQLHIHILYTNVDSAGVRFLREQTEQTVPLKITFQ